MLKTLLEAKECKKCKMLFDPVQSIDKNVCDFCRMKSPPCIDCAGVALERIIQDDD